MITRSYSVVPAGFTERSKIINMVLNVNSQTETAVRLIRGGKKGGGGIVEVEGEAGDYKYKDLYL